VFVLDAPAALMYARTREHSPEVLDRWRRSYLELARRLPEAVVIDASSPAAEVRAQAVHLVWRRMVCLENRRADASATEIGAA
jgi:thymidylate kinase